MQAIDEAIVHDEIHAAMSSNTKRILLEVGGENGAAIGLCKRIADGIADETV